MLHTKAFGHLVLEKDNFEDFFIELKHGSLF